MNHEALAARALRPRGGRRRWWSIVLLCMALPGSSNAADGEPRTWYVRVDGGDAQQCDGRSDAPYSGGRTRQCAWRHPFLALPPGGPARIAGGDTLRIGPGDYRMGFGAADALGCSHDFPWDCHMAAVPSGPTPERPTRISGGDRDGGCRAPPQLWGSERSSRVLNLDGSSNVRVECLEITDRASCVENHCHGGDCRELARCERERFPFGDWAGNGIHASDSRNVELRDLDIHGLAGNGIRAGRLRDWTLTRVRIVGNGWAGWEGDIGKDSANAGMLHFREVEIAWNGCAERWPQRQPFACWGQSSGGYGDGLGTAATAGHWLFEDVAVHHNSSDGLDLLYLKAPGRVTARRLRAHDNAGNQFKASGQVVLSDSLIDGSCASLREGGQLAEADLCRALGNAVALVGHPGTAIVLSGNRVRGVGDCLVVVEGGDRSTRVELRGNELAGAAMWNNPRRRACGFYAYKSQAAVRFDGNAFLGVRNRQCPPGSRCAAALD